MLVRENTKMASELAKHESSDFSQTMIKCAKKIRADVKESKVEQDWPPNTETLNNDYIKMPSSLTSFLSILLTGNAEDTEPSAKMTRQMLAIAQDCVYAISAGTQKPAKHILLPWAVKSLTGNVQ